MKYQNELILSIFLLTNIHLCESQNCFTCTDSPLDTSDRLTVTKSRYHLLQLFGNASYRLTNYYAVNYHGDVEWTEGRLLFPYFSEMFRTTIPLPDFYATAIFKDMKDIYWEQRLDYGCGLEWRPFKYLQADLKPFNWIKHLRFYALMLKGYYYYCDENSQPPDDQRVGLELYKECNLYTGIDPDEGRNKKCIFWSEVWADLSYRTTNFVASDFNSWIFGFVPKVGVKIFPESAFAIMPYCTGEILATGRSDPWQNHLLVGVGLRMMPFRVFSWQWYGTFLRSIKLYIEGSKCVAYLKSRPPAGSPDYDISFGINYSFNRY